MNFKGVQAFRIFGFWRLVLVDGGCAQLRGLPFCVARCL